VKLDLARATAGDKFTLLLHHYCWWDSSKFSLAMILVIIMYLVALSTANMRIYHKLAIGHLMQVCARFALQWFSLLPGM